MIKAKLTRVTGKGGNDDLGTFGKLIVGDDDAGLMLRTLELPWRDNKRSVSCIPAGEYECTVVRSPKFGKVYSVKDVRGRDDILVHAGNVAGDKAKGYRSDVEGCILLGMAEGKVDGQMGVLGSRRANDLLMEFTQGQPMRLTIAYQDGGKA